MAESSTPIVGHVKFESNDKSLLFLYKTNNYYVLSNKKKLYENRFVKNFTMSP